MKVFELRRCLSVANGGCDKYWAELVGHEGCGHGSHGGIPQEHCKCAWGGFDRFMSSKVNRHDFYVRRAVICPRCLHRQDLDWLRAEAQRERRGEFSVNVQNMIDEIRSEKRKEILELTNGAYWRLWDAVHGLIGGLNRQADEVWEGIETALYGHFGVQGMAKLEIQGLVATLQDAKKSLVGHVKATTREMAIGLVGPRDTREVDEEEARLEKEAGERQKEAMRLAVEAAREAQQQQQHPQPPLIEPLKDDEERQFGIDRTD